MTAFVYDLINVIPVCITAVILASGSFVEEDRLILWLIPILTGTGCVALRHMTMRWRIAAAGILTAFLAGMLFAVGGEGRADILERYGRYIPILLFSAGCFLAEKAAQRYRKLKLAMAGAGVVLLLVMMITGKPRADHAAAWILFYALITLSEEIHIHWKREGDPGVAAHMVRILPFPALILILLLLFHAPEEPYDWGFVKAALEKVRLGYELVVQSLGERKGWDSDEAAIGFSDEGILAGGVRGVPYDALTVTTKGRDNGRIYLAGRSFDTFDGREWTKRDDSSEDMMTYDTLETGAAILGYDPEHFSDYMKESAALIEYEGIRTGRMFAPPKTVPSLRDGRLKEEGGDLSFAGENPGSCNIIYYRLNRAYEGFEGFLEDAGEASDEDFEEAVQLMTGTPGSYSLQGLEAYREHVKSTYGSRVELSKEMRSYMDELLEGAATDREKLDRIEKLLSGMRYDTQPGPIPDSVRSPGDFADYMIFEKRSGFCVHYATAFVLLARAEGIPARYMQGYSVNVNGSKAVIGSDMAHAWPEVYLEGVGWIGYEPTPGFRRLTGWKPREASKPVGYVPDHDVPGDSEEADAERKPEDGVSDGKSYEVIRYVSISVFAALLFLLVFLLADRSIRRHRYVRMGDREKAMELGRRSIRVLKRCGLSMKEGETLEEYGLRLSGTLPEGGMRQFHIYEELLYSGRDTDPDEVSQMEACLESLKKYAFRRRLSLLFSRRVPRAAGS